MFKCVSISISLKVLTRLTVTPGDAPYRVVIAAASCQAVCFTYISIAAVDAISRNNIGTGSIQN